MAEGVPCRRYPDGCSCLHAVSDYGKNAGEWVANIYGGNENLEAVEFLKHLNSIYARDTKGSVLIAEESTAWPKVSGDENDGGLGFDFKWNMAG